MKNEEEKLECNLFRKGMYFKEKEEDIGCLIYFHFSMRQVFLWVKKRKIS